MLALCSALALGGVACGDDDEETPPGEGNGNSGKGGGSGKSGSGGKAGGGSGDGGVDEGGSGCKEEEPPTTSEGFLNRDCGSDCEPFDNDDRIEHSGWASGKALTELPDP